MNKKTSESPSVTIQRGVYNTVFTAPNRCGKGVSRIIPALLTYPASMIDSESEHCEKSELSGADLIAGVLSTPVSEIGWGRDEKSV